MKIHRGRPGSDVIASWLAAHGRLVLDGALATELEARGADLNDPLWSARLLIEQPDLIRQVHLDYFRAGADVATSASYQATFEGFARRGFDVAQAEGLMRLAVRLAIEARDQFWAEWQAQPDAAQRGSRSRPLVAASVGPYGAMCADGSEYRGYADRPEVDEAALMAFHRPRLQVLASSGADLLACETLPCLAEARALARLMDELPAVRDGMPVTRSGWISFSCADGSHTSAGEDWMGCVAALAGFGRVAAIGVNCTAPQHIEALVATARAHSDRPILVYPNAGERYDATLKQWQAAPGPQHAAFTERALRWAAAGANAIGGCCRTSPANIAALARHWRTA